MTAITLAQAEAQLSLWLERLSQAQTLEAGAEGRTVKYADPDQILRQVKFWEARVNQLKGTGNTLVLTPTKGL